MDIIHLSSSSQGGAAVAAHSLNEALESLGISSRIYTVKGSAARGSTSSANFHRSQLAAFTGKALTVAQSMVSLNELVTPISFPSGIYSQLTKFNPANTIIHIHNWYNFLTLKEANRLVESGYKIFMTLHDQRAFTGGCHYALGCEEFSNSCRNCPEIRFPKQIISISHRYASGLNDFFSRAQFICPSEWMLKEARKSSLMTGSKIEHIPNVLTVPNSRPQVMRRQGNLILGVASMDPFARLKGGELVKKLINSDEYNQVFEIRFLRDFTDFHEDFWQNIDYLLVPSVADNSPNVIFEAGIRGIPVISSNVGGTSESLTPGFDFIIDFQTTPISSWLKNVREARGNLTDISRNIRISALKNRRNAALLRHLELYGLSV